MIKRASGSVVSRRDLLLLAAAGGAALTVGGCGGGGGGSSGVTWQAIPSYSLQGTDPRRVEYLTRVLAEFEGASGADIVPEVTTGDTVSAMARLQLQAAEGRAPDVAQVDGYLFGGMASHAQPLTGHMEAAGLRMDDWFPGLHPVMTGDLDSTVRALPFTTDVRVLYHRRDIVPTPPGTWEELITVARPLAAQGRVVVFPGGRSEGAVATMLWPQFWAHDLELFDGAGSPTFGGGAGYAAMRDALGVVEQLVAAGVSPQRVATFGAEDDLNSDIVAGRVAMFVGGSWQAAALNNALPSKDFFDTWGVAPIPSLTGERHITTAGGWVWASFSDNPASVDAGIRWVTRAFVDDDGMAAWCTAGGYLPPRQSVYDNPAYGQNPFTPTFREHLAQYAKTRPGVPAYVDVSASMQIALSSVASGTAGATQALDEALSRIV